MAVVAAAAGDVSGVAAGATSESLTGVLIPDSGGDDSGVDGVESTLAAPLPTTAIGALPVAEIGKNEPLRSRVGPTGDGSASAGVFGGGGKDGRGAPGGGGGGAGGAGGLGNAAAPPGGAGGGGGKGRGAAEPGTDGGAGGLGSAEDGGGGGGNGRGADPPTVLGAGGGGGGGGRGIGRREVVTLHANDG